MFKLVTWERLTNHISTYHGNWSLANQCFVVGDTMIKDYTTENRRTNTQAVPGGQNIIHSCRRTLKCAYIFLKCGKWEYLLQYQNFQKTTNKQKSKSDEYFSFLRIFIMELHNSQRINNAHWQIQAPPFWTRVLHFRTVFPEKIGQTPYMSPEMNNLIVTFLLLLDLRMATWLPIE